MSFLRPPTALISLLAVLPCVACADLTQPATGAPAKPADTAAAAPPSPTPVAPTPAGERITASHILIAFQGARRSSATRSKDEAKKLAEDVLAKAKGGQDFAALSSQFSDDTGAKAKGGSLGSFAREQMVPTFSTAAFALRPGQLSGVVETDFGFHIIKRTE